MANTLLNIAKKEKNDEFYTSYKDIEDELQYYKEAFKDKVVYCNCDRPCVSEFWNYFEDNFNFLGLKKLVATYFDQTKSVWKTEIIGSTEDTRKILKTKVSGDGDFRSQEYTELLKEADIVVTNPPFSLFREYVAQLIRYDKKFLIIGNLNAITYKEIFPLIKDNKVWLGYCGSGHTMHFAIKDNRIGEKFKSVTAVWYTNLDIQKRHEALDLHKRYSSKEYPKYDNYDAININKVADIPKDYDGIMGVPITFLEKHCPDQFKIIGTISAPNDKDTLNLGKDYSKFVGYTQDGETNGRTGATFGKCPVIVMDDKKHPYYSDGNIRLQTVYHRIFIQKASKYEDRTT